jgi:hypothetical protein
MTQGSGLSGGAARKADAALEAELSVSSSDLTLGDLEERLGRASGPAGYSRGDPSGFRGGPPRVRSCWAERLDFDPDRHPGTAGLDLAILGLDTGLADRLAQCRRDGCEVVLCIVQRIPVGDQGWATGLHLSAESLGWLARAGAETDVDQYVGTPGSLLADAGHRAGGVDLQISRDSTPHEPPSLS